MDVYQCDLGIKVLPIICHELLVLFLHLLNPKAFPAGGIRCLQIFVTKYDGSLMFYAG
jgi:hypothetical protein